MSTRWYPIYQKGNPQLRIFLPNFWLKLVKPQYKQPKNIVQFIAPTEMTNTDIKNYLEKIYKVPIADIRSEIEEGELKRHRLKRYVIKGPDFRRAFVTLKKGHIFEFPDLWEKRQDKLETEQKKAKEECEANYKIFEERNKNRRGLPGWFGI